MSQSYLTAIYPIVIFCYILIQNPLQLPLIQTGKNGIVYEQERLNYEIVYALTRWATRHLELKRQMIENEKNKKKDEKNEKDEKKNDPKNKRKIVRKIIKERLIWRRIIYCIFIIYC